METCEYCHHELIGRRVVDPKGQQFCSNDCCSAHTDREQASESHGVIECRLMRYQIYPVYPRIKLYAVTIRPAW